jgi:hypothetical protein
MFFTSAITSILPYILFFGIICTYYLGITNDNLRFFKNHEVASVIYLKADYDTDRYAEQNKKDFHDYLTDFYALRSDTHLYLSSVNIYEAFYSAYNKNLNKRDLLFSLFSRPPPFTS